MEKFAKLLIDFILNEDNKGKFLSFPKAKLEGDDLKALQDVGFKQVKNGIAISYDDAVTLVMDIRAGITETKEMESTMPFELNVQEDGTVVLEAEEVEALKGLIADSEEAADKMEELATQLEETNTAKTDLEAKVDEAAAKIAELEGQIKTLTVNTQPEKTEREIALETRIIELERGRANDKVEMIIAKAKNKVDENGNAHSAVFLELARKLMLGETIEVDAETAIKLENAADAADYGRYVRSVVAQMLDVVPGQLRVKSETVNDEETRNLEDVSKTDNMFEAGKEAAATIWSAV